MDGWLSEPYMEMISEVVSRYDGKRRLSSRGMKPSEEPSVRCGRRKARWPRRPGLGLSVPSDTVDDVTGLMEKRPISPVSVVVFSMLSNGPGEGRSAAFSFTLRRGRANVGWAEGTRGSGLAATA